MGRSPSCKLSHELGPDHSKHFEIAVKIKGELAGVTKALQKRSAASSRKERSKQSPRPRRVKTMAVKQKTLWCCKECGHNQAKWTGQCPTCHQWNCLAEETDVPMFPTLKLILAKKINR